MNLKGKWIKAYEKTLQEYQEGVHQAQITTCAKCLIVKYSCDGCPETVFVKNRYDYGCIKRKIYARDSRSAMAKNGKQQLLIEYHKQAIELLKTIPNKKFQLSNFNMESFAGLKVIDKNIYDAKNESRNEIL